MSLERFWISSEEWSLATFGSEEQRGPLGPSKHALKDSNRNEPLEHEK